MTPSLDVLICSHNEAAYIGRTLESLEGQSCAPASFGVIVVDNASEDATGEVVRQHRSRLNLSYVSETQLGLNYARNAGYRYSMADYVAHIDADAIADPNWIAGIHRVISHIEPDLLGGPYFPYYLEPKPAWFQDRYNSNDLGRIARWLAPGEYLSGTNMIWRRRFVDELGGFRNALGLVGRGLARGD